MAVVDRAERDVVVELGVPGPISDGVTGSEGGGGRLIRVGVVILPACTMKCVLDQSGCRYLQSRSAQG
jgi:hypothetical protein